MGERPAAALSTNLQKAVKWIGEIMLEHPEKQRNQVVTNAQLRFDLTPTESEFLNHNFKELTVRTDQTAN
ncbi:MAG: hypothetical protein D3924_15550 [Candidatus Electrothrix sp. AR4]|nr:hypothetical protein [Candidatus Electrothrix sp. AR4]